MLEQKFPSDLAKAAHDGKVEEVEKILAAGGDTLDIAAVDSLDQTALIFCVRNVAETKADAEARAAITKMLVAAKADVNTPDKYGDTPLCLACMDGGGVHKAGVVQALLDGGAEVNVVSDNFKMTPLHWAAVCGHTEVCRVLVDAGAKKKKIDRQRKIPLEVAENQLKRLQDNLDHFGNEYSKDDKPQQTLKYTKCVDYLKDVTTRKVNA